MIYLGLLNAALVGVIVVLIVMWRADVMKFTDRLLIDQDKDPVEPNDVPPTRVSYITDEREAELYPKPSKISYEDT